MNSNRTLIGIVCRVAAFSFLAAGSASLLQAQQTSPVESTPKVPLFLAAESAPLNLASNLDLAAASSSSSSSSSDAAVDSNGRFMFSSAALDGSQPPPRRYGRPNYSDSHSNPDGSSKYTFMAGGGLALPVGNTHRYETPSYDFQVGGGRNFNKSLGLLLQFDYDHFGLQGATIANQEYLYDYGCPPGTVSGGTCGVPPGQLDGNNHVWSFTLDPTFTLATEGSMGAYFVVGGGFYHKVTNFSLPSTGYVPYGYGYYPVTSNQNVDHYTSNAGGVNGGIGLTYKFSKFASERFYVEARYVVVFNQQRYGFTAQNVATTNYNGNDSYPANANRTTFIPITVGLRF